MALDWGQATTSCRACLARVLGGGAPGRMEVNQHGLLLVALRVDWCEVRAVALGEGRVCLFEVHC